MSIFREYDIRGIVGPELTEPIAERIGWVFAQMIQENGGRVVSIARDARFSSPQFFEALARGISVEGIEIVDLGICPTPLLYFSLYQLSVDGGIVITGSHNPGDYNGFKLCIGRDSMYGEAIQELRKRVEAMEKTPLPEKKPKIRHEPIIPRYQDYLKERFKGLSAGGMKVVLDSGNGTGGIVAPDLFRAFGCQVIELFSEPDGRFPNHHPDPTVEENLQDLIGTVRKNRAAFGIAYDGDADRIGVVTDRGDILWGDQLLLIFSRDILKRQPGATIISEVKASQVLFDDIRDKGGRAIMWRTGHSLIKAKMKEEAAAMAGEMSGHLFFADRYFGYDDAVYASLRLLELIIQSGQSLSSLVEDLPKVYSTPEIRVDCPDDKKFAIVDHLIGILNALRAKQESAKLPIRDLITIDGVRVVFDEGWGLVRASNTQPVLVLRFEAASEERLSEIRTFIESKLDL